MIPDPFVLYTGSSEVHTNHAASWRLDRYLTRTKSNPLSPFQEYSCTLFLLTTLPINPIRRCPICRRRFSKRTKLFQLDIDRLDVFNYQITTCLHKVLNRS